MIRIFLNQAKQYNETTQQYEYIMENLVDEQYYAGFTITSQSPSDEFKAGSTICTTAKVTLGNEAFTDVPERIIVEEYDSSYDSNIQLVTSDNNNFQTEDESNVIVQGTPIYKTIYTGIVDSYEINDFTTDFSLTDNMVRFNFSYDAPLINKTDKKNVSGDNTLYISDSIDAPLDNVTIKGFTEQDGTPSPSNQAEINVLEGTIDLKSTGKNLYNGSLDHTFANASTGVISVATSSPNKCLGLEHKVNVNPNTRYTIKFYDIDSNYEMYYTTYDINEGYIERKHITTNNGTVTLTTDSNVYYIFCWLYDDSEPFITTDQNVQLEQNNVATEYEEYEESSVQYSLGNSFVAENDYIEDGILHKSTGKIVLDGTEDWGQVLGEDVSYNTYRVENLITAARTDTTHDYLSDYFVAIASDDKYQNNTFFIDEDNRIVISYDDITSTENFKTWLSTHNVTIYYELKEEVTEEITTTGTLETFYKHTSIIKDSDLNFSANYSCTTSASLFDIFKDICDSANVATSITSFYQDNMNVSWYDNTYSARQYLDMIAEINCITFYINGDGELEYYDTNMLSDMTMSNLDTYAGLYQTFDDIANYKIGSKHIITRIVFDDTNVHYEFGSNLGETYYIDYQNVYCINQSIVEHVYNTLNGMTYYDFKTENIYPTSSVENDDIPKFSPFAFTDGTTLYKTFLSFSDWNYSGEMWHGGTEYEVKNEEQQETEVIDTNKIIRGLKTIIDRDNATITNMATQTEINSNDISRIDTTITTLASKEFTIESINESIQDGTKTLSNSLVTIDINGISVSTNESAISTLLDNEKFEIKSGETTLAFFGYEYDDDTHTTGSTKAKMANLTVENFLVTGYHRIQKWEAPTGTGDDTLRSSNRTGFFWIGE